MEIKIVKGDITELKVEAIVNSASLDLLGGLGVDGAIHAAAGPELLAECQKLGGCKTGQAKITKGYALPAKYVIHTVGPVYSRENGNKPSCAEASEGKAELLAACYKNCLELAKEKGIRTIAFPAISTGVYGYPKKEAAKIAVKTVKDFCNSNPARFDEIIFVCFDDKTYEIYEKKNG